MRIWIDSFLCISVETRWGEVNSGISAAVLNSWCDRVALALTCVSSSIEVTDWNDQHQASVTKQDNNWNASSTQQCNVHFLGGTTETQGRCKVELAFYTRAPVPLFYSRLSWLTPSYCCFFHFSSKCKLHIQSVHEKIFSTFQGYLSNFRPHVNDMKRNHIIINYTL